MVLGGGRAGGGRSPLLLELLPGSSKSTSRSSTRLTISHPPLLCPCLGEWRDPLSTPAKTWASPPCLLSPLCASPFSYESLSKSPLTSPHSAFTAPSIPTPRCQLTGLEPCSLPPPKKKGPTCPPLQAILSSCSLGVISLHRKTDLITPLLKNPSRFPMALRIKSTLAKLLSLF